MLRLLCSPDEEQHCAHVAFLPYAGLLQFERFHTPEVVDSIEHSQYFENAEKILMQLLVP